jgi:hypothetical protein
MKQAAFSSTLMGVLQPLIDHRFRELDPLSDDAKRWKRGSAEFAEACAFVLTGHAFLINIHHELCPSGPYCWKDAGLNELLQGLGLQRKSLSFLGASSSAKERVEQFLKVESHLAKGGFVGLLNMEHQCVLESGADHLSLSQPWGTECQSMTPRQLTFPAFPEFGEEIHCHFYLMDFCEKKSLAQVLKDTLRFALRLWDDSDAIAFDGYGVGRAAYKAWEKALETHGNSHGCWWNAQVWREGRLMLSRFFGGLSLDCEGFALPETAPEHLKEIATHYEACANALLAFESKEREGDAMLKALYTASEAETKAVQGIARLLATI